MQQAPHDPGHGSVAFCQCIRVHAPDHAKPQNRKQDDHCAGATADEHSPDRTGWGRTIPPLRDRLRGLTGEGQHSWQQQRIDAEPQKANQPGDPEPPQNDQVNRQQPFPCAYALCRGRTARATPDHLDGQDQKSDPQQIGDQAFYVGREAQGRKQADGRPAGHQIAGEDRHPPVPKMCFGIACRDQPEGCSLFCRNGFTVRGEQYSGDGHHHADDDESDQIGHDDKAQQRRPFERQENPGADEDKHNKRRKFRQPFDGTAPFTLGCRAGLLHSNYRALEQPFRPEAQCEQRSEKKKDGREPAIVDLRPDDVDGVRRLARNARKCAAHGGEMIADGAFQRGDLRGGVRRSRALRRRLCHGFQPRADVGIIKHLDEFLELRLRRSCGRSRLRPCHRGRMHACQRDSGKKQQVNQASQHSLPHCLLRLSHISRSGERACQKSKPLVEMPDRHILSAFPGVSYRARAFTTTSLSCSAVPTSPTNRSTKSCHSAFLASRKANGTPSTFDNAASASASSSHMSRKASLRSINLRIASSDCGNRRNAAENASRLSIGPLPRAPCAIR